METINSTDPEELNGVDPKEVKGVDTSTGKDYSEKSDDLGSIKKEDFYTPGKSAISRISGTSVDIGASTNNLSVDAAAAAQFTAVDIAKGIRDPNERARFIKEQGSKMTTLTDGVVGIKFDDEIADYSKFRQKQYDTKVAKLLDDLDENQGFLDEFANFTGKLLGRTFTAVTGIIPVVYGIGEAIITGNGKRLYDNSMYDQWEKADKALDEYFVVYGGDSYTAGEEKNVFSRFWDNPMKSLADDFAPTIAFVAGAVGTSYITGGVGAFQASKGLSYINGLSKASAKTNLVFKNGVKWARGIKNFEDVAQYGSFVEKYSKGLGTINQMILSAGYESALIARDTQNSTALNSKISYIQDNAELAAEYDNLVREHMDEFGNMDKTQEELVDELAKKFPTSVARKIQYAANQAGNLAFFTNVPLVGASNLIQFSKAFNSSYKAGQSLITKNALNPLKGAVKTAEGKLVTAASQATRGQKILGYTGVVLKPGLTEAFEEFSQGVIEKGYSDYYALEYKDGAIQDTKNFLDSVATQASLYANSVEGFDSVALGFLMGMVGLPVGINRTAAGKTKIGFGFTGGIKESLQEFKQELARTNTAVEHYNEKNFNEVLKNNLTAAVKQIQIQKDLDKYAEEENIFDYKNAEFQSIYNFIENRIKNEIGETVFQDIDALEKMSLEQFNEQFAFKEDSFQFTEKTKKQAIESMKNTAESIMKAHEDVNTVLNYKRGFIDRLFKTNFEGLSNEDQFLTESLTDQMKFLYASGLNIRKREEELTKRVSDLTKGKLNVSELGVKLRSKVETNKDGKRKKEEDTTGLLSEEITGISKDKGKAVFADQVTELKKMIKDQIKFDRETEIEYNKNSVEIDQIVEDVVKLRDMESKTWELYKTLFTPKGAKKFAEIKGQLALFKAIQLQELNAEQQKEELAKKKSSEGASKVATNATSTNNEFIVEEQLQKDLQKVDRVRQEEKQKLLKNKNQTDADTANYAIKVLESMSPLLFAKIKELSNNSGETIFSDEVVDIIQGNGDPATVESDRNNTFKILNQLIKENKEANNKPIVTLDYANEEDNKPFVNSVTPTPGSTKENHNTNTHLSLKERLAQKLEEQQGENYVDKGTTSSDKTTILMYSDKIGRTGLIPDGDGGYIAVNEDMPITEASNKKVNDGTFLSNEELKDNNVRATFKLVEDSPYIKKLKAENNYNETTAPIDVYYGDTFIGRLPGSTKTSTPEQLRNLRKALFKQLTADEAVNQEAPGVYTGYKSTVVPTALESLEQQLEAEEALEFGSEEIIKDLKQQIKDLAKTETKETTTPIKKGVSEIFEESPELEKIGTKEEYSKYLDTIFPDSKVKDIVYRGGEITKEEFEKRINPPTDFMDLGEGLYLSPKKRVAAEYGDVRTALVNIKNPRSAEEAQDERSAEENFGKISWQMDDGGKYDGIVDLSQPFKDTFELVVFNENQVYILGSKQDLKGFKEFVNKTTTPEREMSEAEELYVGILDIMMELEPGTKEWDDAVSEMAELEDIISKEREAKGLPSPRSTEQKGVKIREQSTQEEINESKETVKKLLKDIDQVAEAGQRPNRDLIGAIFQAKLVQARNYSTPFLKKMISNKKEKIKASKNAENLITNAAGRTAQDLANLISLRPILENELKALESLLAEGVTPSEAALETTSPETEVEQSAREKVIDKNFKSIIKQLTANPIMQGDEFIGEKKC
jgi:hypothetical protein